MRRGYDGSVVELNILSDEFARFVENARSVARHSVLDAGGAVICIAILTAAAFRRSVTAGASKSVWIRRSLA